MKLQEMWATLRTFSLDYDTFPTMIENVALLLRTMTINIYKNDIKGISWLYYVITIITGVCYCYGYIFSMVWVVCVRYRPTKNYTAIAIAISHTTCSVTSITKLFFMTIHAGSLRHTIERFLRFDARFTPGSRLAANLRKNLRVVKRRAIIIWISLITNGLVFLLIPFLRPGRHLAVDSFIYYGLEPMLESPNYEIINTVTVTGVCFCVYVMVNVAVYVIVIVGYNEAQLYTMSEEVRSLWDDSQDFYDKIKHKIRDKIHAIYIKEKLINEFIRIRLKAIVHHHVTNINLFKELNNKLSLTLAIEYTLLSIAIIVELLGGLENTYRQVPYTVVQLIMDCLSGQRLIDACHEFEKALYSCKWENFNASNQKTVLLMLAISQKTLMLSAGGMANLNYICLMMILRSSYSTYTALKSSLQHQ